MKFSLTELRHSRGWSQEQLGERLGVTRQTVSKWELGSTTPELEKLAMMSDIFGVSTDELIKGEPQEASRPSEPSEPAEAIQDTKPLRSRLHFEYKSRRTVRGLPLVHINFGAGRYTAKGIFALGNKAVGVVAGGFLSVGADFRGASGAGDFLGWGACIWSARGGTYRVRRGVCGLACFRRLSMRNVRGRGSG